MEYRREPRFQIDQPLTVTSFGNDASPIAGRLANFSARGVQLILDHELPMDSDVKIEWEGTLLLGEVVYCRPQGPGYLVGVALEEALFDTHAVAEMSEDRQR